MPKIVPDYADSSAFKPKPDVRSRTVAMLNTIGGFFVLAAVMIGTIYIMDLCSMNVVRNTVSAHDMEDAGVLVMTLAILFLLGNGVVYLLCAAKIRRHARWGAIVALVFSAIHFGTLLITILITLAELTSEYIDPTAALVAMILGLFGAVVAVAAFRLITGLTRLCKE